MKLLKAVIGIFVLNLLCSSSVLAQSSSKLKKEITNTMMKATQFMADNASENGGYVGHYLPDFSRRWGEMEAYPTMIWVQEPGTISMGNTFLDAYFATHNEYYYQQAKKAAEALVWGQLPCGGWNYFINFGGLKSTLNWYNTIGKNGWRLEEFQHYYGNATYDDGTTSHAALYLLRFYLVKLDPTFLPPIEKAIHLVLKSEYPLGGWPQRYPLHHDFHKNVDPDYTSFYTFNDNVGWQNVKFLTACYATLNYHSNYYYGENTKLLDAIRRGMMFFLISQEPFPYAGWGQQYSMNLKPASARTYEPASLDPQYTAGNIEILLKFYEMTGDRRYLERIPDALTWLKEAKIGNTKRDGVYIYAKFVDPNTGKPLYTHRVGSDVVFGHYYVDHDSLKTVAHYSNFRVINLKKVEDDYKRVSQESPSEAVKNSPLLPGKLDTKSLRKRYDEVMNFFSSLYEMHISQNRGRMGQSDKKRIEKIINSLDSKGRWLVTSRYTSHPYIGEPKNEDPNTKKYMTTHVGDKYDTSPYIDTSNQKYISTSVFTRNMEIMIHYLDDVK